MMIFILEKLHYSEISPLDFIVYMLKHKLHTNLMIVMTYNDSNKPAIHISDRYVEMIRLFQKNQLVIDCNYENNLPETKELVLFTLDETAIREYIILIKNMIDTLAYDQAEYYLQILYHKYEVEKYEIEDRERIEFLTLYGLTSVYNGNMKMAYIVCERIIAEDRYKDDLKVCFTYNYIMGLAKVYSKQKNMAVDHVEKCNEYARILQDDMYIYLAEILFCFVWFDGWRDIFLWDEDINLSDDFFNKALEYKDYNLLSYIYFFGYVKADMERYKKEDASELRGCEKSLYFKLGMKYADLVGNEEVKLRAWEKNVVVAARIGKFDDVMYYYDQCVKLLEGQSRDIDMGMVYNGIGYNCITGEKFEKAKEYFGKSVAIFYKEESPNLLCEALYNIAVCAIVTKEYPTARDCMELILEIIERLEIERLRLCNKSKIYGIIIIACLRLGENYEAKVYFDKMRLVMRYLLESDTQPDYAYWDDDMFLYYLIEGIMKHEQGDLEGALEAFNGARFHLSREKSNQFYAYTELAVEEAKVLQELGLEENAMNLIKTTIADLKQEKYAYQVAELEAFLKGKTFKRSKMGDINEVIDFKGIRSMIWKLGMEYDMRNMMKSLDFLETWVELLNRESGSVVSLIESAMLTLKNSYNIDELIYLECLNDKVEVRFSDFGIEMNHLKVNKIIQYFKKYPNKVVVTRFDRSFDKYEELVDIFGRDRVVSLVGIPLSYKGELKSVMVTIRVGHVHFTENLKRFTENEMEIFRTTFRQLIDAINREEIKLKLEERSITDILTGLLNRQGMKKILEEEFDKMALEGKNAMKFTLIYIDLDNFKYCNDTFGHDIGDLVLIECSKLMRSIVEDQGHIIRYGGDEFVIILPGLHLTHGIAIIENILKAIKYSHGFKNAIEEKLGRKILIKNEFEVSCSAGVSSEECFSYAGITELLKKADQALYKVKMSTKHDYEVWSN